MLLTLSSFLYTGHRDLKNFGAAELRDIPPEAEDPQQRGSAQPVLPVPAEGVLWRD